MSDLRVIFEAADGVAVLTLADGERMNTLTGPLLRGCLDALERVRADASIRSLVLTARGRAFCAGADLGELGACSSGPDPQTPGQYVGKLLDEYGTALVTGLRSLPVPVVCAVNGVAAGGGVGLALAADLVIAARSAYFYLPFVPSLGLVPDLGATWALPRAIGGARALGLALTGRKLSAEAAAQWGLVWECVDDADLQPHAMALARQLAALPAHAIEEARAMFAASERNDLRAQLALERDRQSELADRASFAEGLKAFAERRAPVFRGRMR